VNGRPERALTLFDLLLRYVARVEGDRTFVSPGFDVPTQLVTPWLVLEPLGPEHNERDFEAWTSSIDHIRATPGFEGGSWPHPMTLEENLGDLEMHARRSTRFSWLDEAQEHPAATHFSSYRAPLIEPPALVRALLRLGGV
jgi:hypothetical protein